MGCFLRCVAGYQKNINKYRLVQSFNGYALGAWVLHYIIRSMLNAVSLLKIVLVGLTSLFVVTGCAAGISMLPDSSTETSGDSSSVGRLPVALTTTTLSTSSSCVPGYTVSGNLSGVLCLDPSSFQGVATSGAYLAINPLVEKGIERLMEDRNP